MQFVYIFHNLKSESIWWFTQAKTSWDLNHKRVPNKGISFFFQVQGEGFQSNDKVCYVISLLDNQSNSIATIHDLDMSNQFIKHNNLLWWKPQNSKNIFYNKTKYFQRLCGSLQYGHIVWDYDIEDKRGWMVECSQISLPLSQMTKIKKYFYL